jgi:hypothetical protein
LNYRSFKKDTAKRDDTKYKHTLQASTHQQEDLAQEDLRTYLCLRLVVAADFHRVRLNYHESVIDKFIHNQERERMEAQTRILTENYRMPKGQLMSYKWNGGHGPPTLYSKMLM